MFAQLVRFMLSVILSPRRLLIAALVVTFCYASLVATKARFFPEPAVGTAKATPSAATRRGAHGLPAPGGTRTE